MPDLNNVTLDRTNKTQTLHCRISRGDELSLKRVETTDLMSTLVARQWSRECARTCDDIGASCLLAGMSRSRLLGVMQPCGVSTTSGCCGTSTTVGSSIDPIYTTDTMLPIFGTFHDQVGVGIVFLMQFARH